jgi:phage FluMu protein Com
MVDFLDGLPDLGLPKGRPAGKGRQAPEGDCVPWRSVRCPRCKSVDCPVIDSHSIPVRRHRCKSCRYEFKSFETNYQPPAGPGP